MLFLILTLDLLLSFTVIWNIISYHCTVQSIIVVICEIIYSFLYFSLHDCIQIIVELVCTKCLKSNLYCVIYNHCTYEYSLYYIQTRR